MKFITKYKYIFLLTQVCFILFLVSLTVYKSKHPTVLNIDLTSCSSDYSSYDNNEFFFNESIINTDTWTDALITDDFSLNAGSYTLYIDYECNADKMFCIYDGTATNAYIKNDTGYLRSENTLEMFKFKTIVPLDSLHVNIKYEPFGYLKIKSISVVSNIESLKKALLLMCILFLLLDAAYIKSSIKYDNKKVILSVIGIALVSSLPLFLPFLAKGHDLEGALLRIEGIYLGLKKGCFPVRMHDFCLKGYGYPISIYYGDFSLYLPAFLRMMGFNITEAWKSFVFIINLFTAVLGYACFVRVNSNKKTALLMTLTYTAAPYRLSNLYARAAVGEFTAMTFYPLIALIIYRIYTEQLSVYKSRKYSTFLAIGISCILCTHLLSTEILAFVLIATALILAKKTFKKAIFITLLSAVGKTLLISAFFFIPFLDYYFSVPVAINDTIANSIKTMQDSGAYISDLFSLSHDLFIGDRVPYSPGVILMISFIVGLLLLVNKKIDKVSCFLLIMSAMFLFISTNLFPWDSLISKSFIFRILSQIQLQTRFLCISIILLTLLYGRIIDTLANEKALYFVMIISALMIFIQASVFTGTYEKQASPVQYTNTSTLDSLNVGSGEYMRLGSERFNDYSSRISELNSDHVLSITQNKNELTVSCVSHDSPVDLTIPKYNYKYYHAYDDNGNEYPLRDGINNLITLTLPAGFSGNIHITFKEPLSWRIAELISVLSTITLVYMSFRSRRLSNAEAVL